MRGKLDKKTTVGQVLGKHPHTLPVFERFGIEVPVFNWPAAPRKLLRISAQAYNNFAQYEALASALRQLLPDGR